MTKRPPYARIAITLPPEERILIAEETLQNAPAVAVVALGSRFFDRYEDFLDWKTHRGLD